MDDRRTFLRRLASGAVYTAPVILSVAAPGALFSQSSETTGKGGMGAGMGMLIVKAPDPEPTTSTAPWAKRPGGK